MTEARVLCTSSHVIDLDDGRVLGPGESAESVDTKHAHNKLLLDEGQLRVLDSAPKNWESRNPVSSSEDAPPPPPPATPSVAPGVPPAPSSAPSGGTAP